MTTLKDVALAAYELKKAEDIRKAQEAIDTVKRLDERASQLLRARVTGWLHEHFDSDVLPDPRITRDNQHPRNRAHLTTPDGIVMHFQEANGRIICWVSNAECGITYVETLAQLGAAISNGYGVL